MTAPVAENAPAGPPPRFVAVKCADCGNEQILFRRAAVIVTCQVCGSTLAEPTGGVATLRGEVVRAVE